MYIQIFSVECFRTPKRGWVHPDDLKSCSRGGGEMLFRRGTWHCAKISSFHTGNRHFIQGRQISWMADYTNRELADMLLAYGAADCSGSAA